MKPYLGTRTCIHKQAYAYVYINVCMCVYIYIYTSHIIYVYLYIQVHTYIHTRIHTCIHTYIHTYIQTYTYTHKYIHIHIYIYMHTRTLTSSFVYLLGSMNVEASERQRVWGCSAACPATSGWRRRFCGPAAPRPQQGLLLETGTLGLGYCPGLFRVG